MEKIRRYSTSNRARLTYNPNELASVLRDNDGDYAGSSGLE